MEMGRLQQGLHAGAALLGTQIADLVEHIYLHQHDEKLASLLCGLQSHRTRMRVLRAARRVRGEGVRGEEGGTGSLCVEPLPGYHVE